MKDIARSQRSKVRLLALAALALLASCSSTKGAREVDLPFHVALAPTTTRVVGTASETLPSGAVAFTFDPQQLDGELAGALAQGCFVRVSQLDFPERAADSAPSEVELVARARELGADILAVPSVRYERTAQGDTNDRFWLNLPLFLLGGPMCWFVSDRSYEVRAQIDVRLYDMNMLARGNSAIQTIQTGWGEIEHYSFVHDGTALNFVDRAGSNVGSYALSILVPAGWLARTSTSVEASLSEDAIAMLTKGIERRIREDHEPLLQPAGVRFRIGPGDLAASATSDGRVRVRGRIEFTPSANVPRLSDQVRIDYAGESYAADLMTENADAPTSPLADRIYLIDSWVPFASDATEVKLTVVHGGGEDDRERTFTLAVAAAVASKTPATSNPAPTASPTAARPLVDAAGTDAVASTHAGSTSTSAN